MTKLVCRLLAGDTLLGWCEHQAVTRGDGVLRAASFVRVEVDVSGDPTHISIHWADLNVETRVPCPPRSVKVGDVLTLFEPLAPMVQVGEPPVYRLPPVSTKAPARVDVPVGQLGASGVVV